MTLDTALLARNKLVARSALTISEVADDWHELMISQRTMAAIHCPPQRTTGYAVQPADIPPPQSFALGRRHIVTNLGRIDGLRVFGIFQQRDVELDGNAGTAGNLVVARSTSQQIAAWRVLLFLYRIHSITLQIKNHTTLYFHNSIQKLQTAPAVMQITVYAVITRCNAFVLCILHTWLRRNITTQ